MLALKCIAPHDVVLLRGNHETMECNANVRTYGLTSFIAQCVGKFGKDTGTRVHAAFNEVFAQMPLIAIVDDAVFCVHGGIPKPEGTEDFLLCMKRLRSPEFPRFENLTQNEADPAFVQLCKLTAMGLLWSDPAPAEAWLDEEGFGENPQRGEEIYSWVCTRAIYPPSHAVPSPYAATPPPRTSHDTLRHSDPHISYLHTTSHTHSGLSRGQSISVLHPWLQVQIPGFEGFP